MKKHSNTLVFLLLALPIVNASTKNPVASRRPAFVDPDKVRPQPRKEQETPSETNLERIQAYYHENLHENAEAAKLYDMDIWFDTLVTSFLESVVRRRAPKE